MEYHGVLWSKLFLLAVRCTSYSVVTAPDYDSVGRWLVGGESRPIN